MRLVDTPEPRAGNLSEAHSLPFAHLCHLLDEAQPRRNGEILVGVQRSDGCRFCRAQKAFPPRTLYPLLLAPYLAGIEAASHESCLGKEELPEKENHVFCAVTGWTSSTSLITPTTLCSTPRPSWQSSALRQGGGQESVLCINPEAFHAGRSRHL